MYKKTSEYNLSGLYDAARERIEPKSTYGNYQFLGSIFLSLELEKDKHQLLSQKQKQDVSQHQYTTIRNSG